VLFPVVLLELKFLFLLFRLLTPLKLELDIIVFRP